MKKRALVICMVATVLCCQVDAQYISVHAYDTLLPSAGHTIVRSWGSDRAVSYFVTTGYQPMMEVVDQTTGITRWVNLPDEVYIKDMCVDERTNILYFCGSTDYNAYEYGALYQGDGIIGYIDLSLFYSSNISVRYISFHNPEYTLIKSVNKLVEYDDGGRPHIVAIGEDRYRTNGYIFSDYFCIDCFDITGPSPSVDVAPFGTSERYNDILLTSRFVVFMGYDANPSVQSICYRKTMRNNIDDPIFDYKNLFYNGDDAYSLLHSTEMFDDTVATSYYSVNGSGFFVTRIRVIDILNDMNTNSQEFPLADKTEPDDITHMPVDGSLVLMEKFTTQNGSHNSNFVFIDPYAQSIYNTTIEYKKNEYFQSLTTHDGQYYLAGAGATWFLRDKTQTPTGIPDEGCPSVEAYKIAVINNLQPYHVSSPMEFSPYGYHFGYGFPDTYQSALSIYCTNQ